MPDEPQYFNPPLDPQAQMDVEDEYSERTKRAQSAIDTARTLDEVLAAFRQFSGEPAVRGNRFERLIKRYLQVEPIYKAQFERVWLWDEWPDRQTPDTGVDLVAKYHPDVNDGGLCAIQCKFYEPGRQVPGGDVANFILTAQEIGAVGRIFVSTSDNIRPTDSKRFNNPSEPTTLIGISDLERSAVRWPDIAQPEALEVDVEKFELRPDQREAIDKCVEGFKQEDRGKLILPCGVGKTFTALKLAEEMVGKGGTVLYLVPSIALLGQAMREWSRQADPEIQHRYIGVCSDEKAGAQSEDSGVAELAMPVTTGYESIGQALSANASTKMTVVFATYQSIGRISQAQRGYWPREFDLILCDEAHRTTGVEQSSSTKGVSPFTMVHGQNHVRARKRLYMTATPRIYSDAAKTKAMNLGDVSLYSMDDETLYGPEFHRMSFADAVDRGLLSDYRVLVLNIDESVAAAVLQRAIAAKREMEIPLDDAAKLIGCASALFDPTATDDEESHRPLLRAISFSNTIKSSKTIQREWSDVVNDAAQLLPETSHNRQRTCVVEHVDGTMNALQRAKKLDWLRESEADEYEVRVLSNARCLSEGVDVPALDAVLFMQPRRSQVDVVQAVGRVMRTAPGKQYGYVILPIVIPADEDAATALDNNKRYEVVWQVLQALRSHDERLDAEINQIDLNRDVSSRIQVVGIGTEEASTSDAGIGDASTSFQYKLDGLVVDHFYARVVERVGDRQYWDRWAKDVAKIATSVETRLRTIIPSNGEAATAQRAELKQRFNALLQAMRATTNDALTDDGAISIVAQHMITGPVFDALYPDYDFTSQNPVARSLGEFVESMGDHGLVAEMQGLERFYDSVRRRAEGIDNPNGRRRVLEELYENFFKAALPKEAERLGVVFTPHELVDFILHSVNDVLKEEFGKTLADEGVHILDPFTGMGTFIWRLIANPELIPDDALHRKYTEELHANEILPLAYYMATINIEEAYRERVAKMTVDGNGHRPEYVPFEGIVWRDTFNAPTDGAKSAGRQATMQFMQANDARARRQDETEMTVIVGNPPYSAWQKSADSGNPNTQYPELGRRIRETYAAGSRAQNTNSLHDHYKLAIRWSKDRVQQGAIGFVTNASFLDSNADSGMRESLENELSLAYVVNLRGNLRTQGDTQKREGGPVFGQSSRVPIALSIFSLRHIGDSTCRINYWDVGDYLSAHRKLSIIQNANSVRGKQEWVGLHPDGHHDWINLRDETFAVHRVIGNEDAKMRRSQSAVFALYSQGIKTGRDNWLYSFSVASLARRVEAMIHYYSTQLEKWEDSGIESLAELTRSNPAIIKWSDELIAYFANSGRIDFDETAIRKSAYRPFSKSLVYFDPKLIARPYRTRELFVAKGALDKAICVQGVGGSKPFSVLTVDDMPDLHCVESDQVFALHAYEERSVTDAPKLARDDIVQTRSPSAKPLREAPPRSPSAKPLREARFSRPRENLAICVAGVGATKPFSTLITDIVPDLELVTKGQCFPRYAYERIDDGNAGGSRTAPTGSGQRSRTARSNGGRHRGTGKRSDG